MSKGKVGKRKVDYVPCRLRKIRQAEGKSVVGLAHETGIHKDLIFYIESGRGSGQLATHLKLAKALGVSLDEYFGFGAFEPFSEGESEFLPQDPGLTVERLAPRPGSELTVQRIQITPHKECDLSSYLRPGKPTFFYLAQGGEAKVKVHKTEHFLAPGDHFWLARPVKLRLENPASLPLVLLMIQP